MSTKVCSVFLFYIAVVCTQLYFEKQALYLFLTSDTHVSRLKSQGLYETLKQNGISTAASRLSKGKISTLVNRLHFQMVVKTVQAHPIPALRVNSTASKVRAIISRTFVTILTMAAIVASTKATFAVLTSLE